MNKSILLLLGAVVVLSLVILVSRNMLFSTLPIGATYMSLSNAQFTTTLPTLSCGQGWILTLAQGGLGQSVVGTISASDIGSKSGVKPQNDLRIEMIWDKLAWEYPIKVDYTSKPIRYYDLYTWTCLLPPSDADATKYCGSNWVYYGKKSWSTTCFCVNQINLAGSTGYIDSCQVHSVSTIKVSAGGSTSSASIDTRGQISQKIGNYVYIVWNGNLLKQNCPSTSPYKTFYKDGTWKIGSNSYYQEYATAYDDTTLYLQQAYGGGSWDLNTLKTKIDNLKSKATRFTSYTMSFGNMIWGNYLTGNYPSANSPYVELGVSSDVVVPTYTMYVCADLLKIVQPEPKPQIIDVKTSTFKTGETGYIYVQFKNIGDSGNFQVWAECNQPFSFVGTTQTIGLNAGATTQVSLPITANVGTKTSNSCVVYVKGAGTTNQASKSITVSADPQTYCQPNTLECNPTLTGILKCNSAGSGYDLIQTCASDQVCMYSNGQPVCVNKGTTPKPSPTLASSDECGKILGIFPDIFCYIRVFLTKLGYITSAIVFFVSVLFIRDFAVKPTKKKEIDWVGWIITLAISGLLAFLVYTIWWMALVSLGLYLILKMVLK